MISTVTYNIEKAKRENGYTLLLQKDERKKYILSRYTPREDALSLLELERANKESIWILFGFGFGYILDEILSHIGSETKIIIIEPNKQLLHEQLQRTAKDWILSLENIHVFSGEEWDDIKKILNTSMPYSEIYNINIVTLRGYLEFYTEYYNRVIPLIMEEKLNKILEINTCKSFANVYIMNAIKNRYAIANSYDIRQHKDQYKNIPALIVSAGPSLSKNIHYIKQFKGIIFAVGRTLGAILEQGIKPDFVVSVDPMPITYDTFKEYTNNEIPMITLERSESRVIKDNNGPQYFLNGEPEVIPSLFNIDLPEVLEIGGSVATVCLSAADYMGCDPIVFIGQDLAYTDLKYHADGCKISENKVDINSKSNNDKYLMVDGYDDRGILSEARLVKYLRWFESYIERHPGKLYINATEGGAKILGTKQMTFESVVEQYTDIVKPKMEHKKMEIKVDVDSEIEKYLKELEKLSKVCKKAKKAAMQLVKEYEIYKGARKNQIENIQIELNQLDQRIEQTRRGKQIIENMFEATYYDIQELYRRPLKETILEECIRVATHSEALYTGLDKAVENVIQIITNEMIREK